MAEDEPKFEHGEIEPTEELRKRGELELQVLTTGKKIARCAPCRKGGVTNTDVVALATDQTPDCIIAGDFLCLFHNHRTSMPLPDSVLAERN